MALPIERVAAWVSTPFAHWFGRCDGCGKRRPRLDLYDCYPEKALDGDGGFHWQCAGCMIETLSAKLEAHGTGLDAPGRVIPWWCRTCDRIQDNDDGTGHTAGCLGVWELVTDELARDFFERGGRMADGSD